MRKLLKLLIISLIIIIIIILILLFKLNKDENTIKNNLDNKTSIENINQSLYSNTVINNNVIDQNKNNNLKKFEIVKSRKSYIEVENIILNLITDMKLCNSETSIKSMYNVEGVQLIKKKRQELIENLSYRISNKCNLERTFNSETFKNIVLQETYSINKVYEKKINSNINAYLVYGEFSKSKTEYLFMILHDNKSNAYEAYLDDYIKSNYNLDKMNSLNINKDTIIKNKYNDAKKYTEEEANEKIVQRYFLITKTKLESNPEEIYNNLYSQYKKEFENLESFKNFAKRAKFSKFKEYRIVDKNTHSEIICKDELGNCIVFKERAVMNYSIILDPYRIDLDVLTSEYDTSDENRILLNIQRITQMINMKDYDELYEKLNGVYIANNFSNIEDFNKYINNNFYKRNKIEYITAEEHENGYYIIRVFIINADKESERKLGNIIMNLNEGANFEISFTL